MAKRKSITGYKGRRKLHYNTKQTPTSKAHESPRLDIGILNDEPHSDHAPSGRSLLAHSDLPAGLPNMKKCTEVETDEASSIKHPILKPKTRYIQQDIIKDRWRSLPDNAQGRVESLFRSTERLVITKQNGSRKMVETQAALSSTVNSLSKRLPRMPFPPGTKDAHFNRESMIRDNRVLEMRLTHSLHTIALLKSAISKERYGLAMDVSQLDELKRNARSEDRLRRQHATKVGYDTLHEVLSERCKEESDTASAFTGLFVPFDEKRLRSTSKWRDSKLQSVIPQLLSHMESMESSVSNVKDIDKHLLKVNSVISQVIHDQLSPAE
ncbi:hypothetical protein MMC14_000947 [Varicellaria rhodocarpa]|nr:hypothetical protein [Varicellaria rhodocarpa]